MSSDLTYSRRFFLERFGLGFGGLALNCLLANESAQASANAARDLATRPGHFPAQAKSVIMLFQNGGPSQMDLFDPKPQLQRRAGELVANIRGGNANLASKEPLLPSPYRFQPH